MTILEISSEKQINFNIRHESSLELENKLESIFLRLIYDADRKERLCLGDHKHISETLKIS